ncbi:hypothetical protein L873DRAFT_1074371 [Choiromyces venosus 120613-1]|uniref:Uncharacterized protein n=1 Tax=Choiromyces venosus 120613-1 TaxID=1336337 RepID=A0A3N4JVZ2_9PEZI|nr:hypothetical protein L873DRAFT_1074371 [Choiromyces venosus 120613-1]
MMSYPPTPAFGGFPSVLVNTNRKMSANTSNTTSSSTSPPTYSPGYFPKAASNTPRLPSSTAQIPGIDPAPPGLDKLVERTGGALVEDREEGELSDIEGDGQGTIINEKTNSIGRRQQANEGQRQFFESYTPRLDSQAQPYSPNMPSSSWDDSYRPPHGPRPWGNQAIGSHPVHASQSSTQLPTLPGTELSYSRGWPIDFRHQTIESHEKENFQSKPLLFPESELSPPTGPQHQPQSHNGDIAVSSSYSMMPQAFSQLSTEVLLSNPEALRKETETAVLNMLPLKVTFANMVEEGIDSRVLRKVFTRIGFPVPVETSSPSPSADVNVTQAAQQDTRQIVTSTPCQRTEIERNAQMIRKQLEKAARDKERREAEAKAAELVSEREAAKAEAEKTKRSAEVEAKKEVLRRKIGELNLPAKASSQAPTPVSSAPVVAAIARASADVPRIPGLSFGESDADISNNPVVQLTNQGNEHIDTVMEDSPSPEPKPFPVVFTPAVGLTASVTAPALPPVTPLERPLNVRKKKRPVASDLYSEPQPAKRKFGEQRFGRLIIEVSDDDEDTDGAGDGDDVGHDEARTSRSTPTGTRPSGPMEHVQRRSASTVNIGVALRSVNTAPPGTLNAGNRNGSGGAHAKIALRFKMEEIETLKRAIQEAQQKKKLAAKRGVSTPTLVGTPNSGNLLTSPSDNQTKPAGVEVLECAAGSGADSADRDQRQSPTTKEKESLKEASQEKLKLLLKELEELEAAEEAEKRKQAESEITEKKRRAEKQEKRRKLEAFEAVKVKSREARQKLKEEMERIEKEEMEIEEKKLLLEKELEVLEHASGNGFTTVEGGTESINEALKRKAVEIENLKKRMERSQEDDKTDTESSPPGPSSLQNSQAFSLSPKSPHPQDIPAQSIDSQHPMASHSFTAIASNQLQTQQAPTPAPAAQSFKTRPHEVMDVDDKSASKSSQVNDHESDMDIDMDADIEYKDPVHENIANDDPSSGSSTTSGSNENDSSSEEIIAGSHIQSQPAKDNKPSPQVVRTVVTGQSLKPPQDEATVKNTSGEANVSSIVSEQKGHHVTNEVVASSKVCPDVQYHL